MDAREKGLIHFLGGITLSARDFITVFGTARNPKMKPWKGKPREQGATVHGISHYTDTLDTNKLQSIDNSTIKPENTCSAILRPNECQ